MTMDMPDGQSWSTRTGTTTDSIQRDVQTATPPASRALAALAAAVILAVWLAFSLTLVTEGATPWSPVEPALVALGVAFGLMLAGSVTALPIALASARIRARRARRRATPSTPDTAGAPDGSGPPDTVTVTFRTEGATRRFVPLACEPARLLFSMPTGRLGRRISATVSIDALPDTVSCGAGYLEVLFMDGDGFVVNEVRTYGDEVIVTALLEPAPSAGGATIGRSDMPPG